ncbi:MAG: DUF4097 family beta strand repeat-containing protein [Acutalibacteraceae bacterium]
MTAVQKTIKYLAMAFAIFLSVSIIDGICTGLASVSFIFSDRNKEPAGEMQVYPINDKVSSLAIKISAADLRIKTADKFSVESNHEYISVSLSDGKLCIDETKKAYSVFSKSVTIILYVPETFVFDDVQIETGAGEVRIDSLSADVLELSLGAGEATIENLVANSHSDIEGGAGEVTINGGLLNNLELDMGVGSLTLKSRLEGKNNLNYGIGETKLILLGEPEEYRIELNKGIGEATLDGKSMKNDTVYGTGKNLIGIDGGIGEITVEFLANEIQKAA